MLGYGQRSEILLTYLCGNSGSPLSKFAESPIAALKTKCAITRYRSPRTHNFNDMLEEVGVQGHVDSSRGAGSGGAVGALAPPLFSSGGAKCIFAPPTFSAISETNAK